MRSPRRNALARGLAAGLLVGCGGGGAATRHAVVGRPAPDDPGAVAVAGTVQVEGGHLRFAYRLVNTGRDDVAVIDPAVTADKLERQGVGSFRASYLGKVGDPAAGDAPLPNQTATIIPRGGELAGTAAVTGGWEQLPRRLELCVEVARRPWRAVGDGVAELPYRAPGTPPILSCSAPLRVPGGSRQAAEVTSSAHT